MFYRDQKYRDRPGWHNYSFPLPVLCGEEIRILCRAVLDYIFCLLVNKFKGNAKTKFNNYFKVICQNAAVELPLNLLMNFPGSMLT